jgi:hypothetical protein
MLRVTDFLARLTEAERLGLTTAIDGGGHGARMAALCLTDPISPEQDVTQLLAYLSGAIRQLETARELVRRRA